MQQFSKSIFFAALVFLFACHGKKSVQDQTVSHSEEPQSFFPVTAFLLGQLREIDSMPVTPLKITIEHKKTDSVWLKKSDIRTFAKPFLSPVIDSSLLENFFSEKSFMDQTINAVTLSYDPQKKLPDSIKLNHWDVYIDPQKNTVQRIYMVKEETINGTVITTQLTWKVNTSCSVVTIEQQPKMAPLVKEQIMKWNFDD